MLAKLLVYKGKTKTREILLELPATVGRGDTAAVTIKHPVVSRQHCEIYEAGGLVKVRDLGSTNGTSVHGKKVAEAVLRPGDRFTIGSFTFVVEYETLAAAAGEEEWEGAAAGAGPAPVRDRRPAAEELPEDEQPLDDVPRLADEPGSSDFARDDAPPSEAMPGLAPDEESEAASPPRERPKKRAAAPARTAGLDASSEPDFEEMLDDFFEGLQGRDLEDFLKGIE